MHSGTLAASGTCWCWQTEGVQGGRVAPSMCPTRSLRTRDPASRNSSPSSGSPMTASEVGITITIIINNNNNNNNTNNNNNNN